MTISTIVTHTDILSLSPFLIHEGSVPRSLGIVFGFLLPQRCSFHQSGCNYTKMCHVQTKDLYM